ncbi:unnamed protein product [Adineta steineri]|uniref:BACK domain-containing protein n=1 Tax=Adineta steineri TaxID=433720 RepID=A0A815MCL9_9BILA|nr:unnamed protein product [Adineta steineri]CAF1469998.1 unnamed protein product [Adineta steineri]CAF4115288.1 unnamed protein product [Adineta steineri]CAF4168024.1 unnamed protein product [Adineta steineri]
MSWVASRGNQDIDRKYIVDTILWDKDPDQFLGFDENDIRTIPEDAFKKILASENFKSDEIKVYYLAMKWIASRGNQDQDRSYVLNTIKWDKIHARDLTKLVAVEGLLPATKVKLLMDNWIEKFEGMCKTGRNGCGIITIKVDSETWSTGHNVGGYIWSFRVVNDGSYGCSAYIRFDGRLNARSTRCEAKIKVRLTPFLKEDSNSVFNLEKVIFENINEEISIDFKSVREVNPKSFGVFVIEIEAVSC